MTPCCWCTSDSIADLLLRYASKSFLPSQLASANDDLCYCLECVDEYHKARDAAPSLHKVLWELETTRLITHFEKLKVTEDDLYLVEEDRETPLPCYTGPDFEKHLRMPLLEILKYPYLLLDERLCELCVEALCKMEKMSYSFQVVDKHPGIYLLMVHPSEVIRRWAILAARNLGKVDRDDYYDIQEVLTCLFKVIELGLFENLDIYNSSEFEKGKFILLPSHLYDTRNYKNYWLGICMLLTVLEEQAMESLLLGPDKQINFVQSIMSTMEKPADDESNDPFWPALHCFMVILDKLGSKVWGQPIDPVQAFQTIINSPSYKNEIKSIRQNCQRTKSEPLSDYGDEMSSCSQLVYKYHTDKPKKDVGWKTAICPDYCPNLYEDMQTLADMLQHDVGHDMRLHNSTFLWFIPFVHSVMDLKEGAAYNGEVIHHLCSEIKDVFNEAIQYCDKASEFFIWILLSVIELHHNKSCLQLLWFTSQKWVEAMVKCAKLPRTVFARSVDRSSRKAPRPPATILSQGSDSVQSACMKLIRSLLKEGYQLGQKAVCEPFLNNLNLFVRSGAGHNEGWQLNPQETQELQASLKQVLRSIKDKASHPSAHGRNAAVCLLPSSPLTIKQEKGVQEARSTVNMCLEPQLPYSSPLRRDEVDPEGRSSGLGEMRREASSSDQPLSRTSRFLLDIKQEPEDLSIQEGINLGCSRLANEPKDALKKGADWTSKLKQLVTSSRRGTATLGPAAEKPPSAKGGGGGLEGQGGENGAASCSKLSMGLGRPEGRPASAFPVNPLSIKQEPKDTPMEFTSCPKVQRALEGSSSDDEDLDNVPLTQIQQTLMMKKKKSATAANQMTNSQIDRDLCKLSLASYANVINFPVDSSQESTMCFQDHIKRKVRGTVRSWSDKPKDDLPSRGGKPPNPVIVISDSSSDEDEKDKKEETTSICLKKRSSPLLESAQEPLATSSSPVPGEEGASQCFEFETDEEIYSAWLDSQMDEKMVEEPGPPVKTWSCSKSPDAETIRQINDWGYDTDYLGDDVTEEAAEALEQQVQNSKTEKQQVPNRDSKPEARPRASADEETSGKGNTPARPKYFTEMRANDGECSRLKDSALPLKSTSAVQGSSAKPGKVSVKSQRIKDAHKSPMKKVCKPNADSKKLPQTEPVRSAPAVIPQVNVRRRPSPKSAVENLHLKKLPRKAYDLSQRSLDSVTELREHGKTAGKLIPLQKRKSKLIPAPPLVGRNRKLFAPKEHQFHRQSRPKEREKGGCAQKGNPEARAAKIAKPPDPKPCLQQPASRVVDENRKEGTKLLAARENASSSERKPLRQSSLEKEDVQPSPTFPMNKKSSLTRQNLANSDGNIQESTTVVPSLLDTLCPITEGRQTNSVVSSGPLSHPCDEGAISKDSMSTSRGDIEEEEEEDGLFLTQMDPADMELCSQLDIDIEINIPQSPLSIEMCRHVGCTEKAASGEAHGKKHSARDPPEHVFAKPSMPAKLSTTKIFSSSSSSRSANLSKELAITSRPPAPPKNKSDPAKATASKPDAFRPQTPTLRSILRPQNLNHGPQLQAMQNAQRAGISKVMPALGGRAEQEARPSFPQSHAGQRDHKNFIREVLKWSYDMFANFGRLGAPDNLTQPIVGSVPVQFQDYNDYFKTFFSLMMLNAFEIVAQEWLENRKSKEQRSFHLNLLNFTSDLHKADFTVEILESDLDNQVHPKEDDLVFLTVSEKRKSYCEENEADSLLVHHVGLVSRFSPPSGRDTKKKREKAVACHLSIQTQGNLSRIDKQVTCVVVSSLVTTQRRFRALLLLVRSPLSKPILQPSCTDFCPKDLSTDSENSAYYMKEFNRDQRRAIDTAYAMVTQQPSSPKICLIHGPPGTGKSKTILGLLCRILNERSGKENPVQSLNAKIKRNRVLVCAPSNAAVDELMKKIILVFKERCQDKANPLGNCGDINLVRLGQEKSISKEVRKFSLNDLIHHRLNRAALGKDQDLHKRKEELDQQLDTLSRQRAMDRSENREKIQQLEEEICRLSKERQRLASQLKEVRGRSQEMKATIILESHIICCTLSTSGGMLLESAFRRQGYDPFSCIIVDEAGQSCEDETLIPLIHGCKKLVLVGDPKQLPPTVISMRAQDYGYDQSLMGRLCRYLEEQVQGNLIGRSPVLELRTQYRMHPDLLVFPSSYIYGGNLETNGQTADNRCSLEWPFLAYLLFDVRDGQEERESDSFVNPQEVQLVIELVKLIKERKRDISYRNIGIITPYSAQKKRILEQLEKRFRESRAWEVDTVDGFQGREKDCIIVTCVRANSTQGSIGFLKSLQRLNVTITRAKYSLFILGQLKTLMENKDWNQLIQDAQRRGAIFRTCSGSFRKDAAKILKLPRGLPSAAGGEPKETPGREPRPPSATTGAPAHRSSGIRPAPQDTAAAASSKNLHLPAQAKPPSERPQDPRLARRAESAACREGHLSASRGAGVVLPPAPPGQRDRSAAALPTACWKGSSSKPVLTVYPQGSPFAAASPRTGDHGWRAPGAPEDAKTPGRGAHPSPTEWAKDRDHPFKGRRSSEEALESRSPADTKRRKTTP
ncbi:probable helicase senataxin isoform X2 [Hemicordylus capensis]|nr:probable helicase senataxin isoform X2 [Hemicordylus capensis]XP_053137641.1 probable helicase senataxin isoform X2 [Hemicordylus capensis]